MTSKTEGYREKVFHFNMVPVIMFFFILLVCLGLFYVLIDLDGGRRTLEEAIAKNVFSLAVATILTVAFLVVAAVYNKLVPTTIGPEGLATYNGLGVPTQVKWADITGTGKLTLFPGFSWLIIKNGSDIFTAPYVSLFIEEPSRFYEGVKEYAGPEHPLATAFERYAPERHL